MLLLSRLLCIRFRSNESPGSALARVDYGGSITGHVLGGEASSSRRCPVRLGSEAHSSPTTNPPAWAAYSMLAAASAIALGSLLTPLLLWRVAREIKRLRKAWEFRQAMLIVKKLRKKDKREGNARPTDDR